MKPGSKQNLRKRVNMLLAPDTIHLLDTVAGKGRRGRFIDQAVRYFVETKAYANLRTQLEEGYRVRARHDAELAEEWFSIDEEAWQNHGR